jgi:Na+/proline symporter
MRLDTIDWVLVVGYFVVSLGIGVAVSRRAGSSVSEFFLSGRRMPWWLLGVSLVATTFSTDTPNCITDMLRTNGIAGNWIWWAFVLTGMSTVFIYAKLWRRSGVLTDLEFYELRYSGALAGFLRGFRAIYLGVLFNILIMASVSLAAIKIGGVMFGFTPVVTLLISMAITVIYSMLGGFTGVLVTDFFQFGIAMTGAVYAACYVVQLPEVGGLQNLLAHPNVRERLSMWPDFSNTELALSVFIVPLAVQWWAAWYPGSEPGGGGYVAQRMLAARTERDSIYAVLSFNIMHYALRPWPWLLVALASLIVYPDIDSLVAAFPHIDPRIVKNDLAYPAMLTSLPAGWLGLVVASLIAAYMSTIATHLNWGSSYIVNDFYRRFVNPDASQKELVRVARISIVVLMAGSCLLALGLRNAFQNFQYMILFGAGTGLLYILRWFWWRINAAGEITAMVVSLLVTLFFAIIYPRVSSVPLSDWKVLCINVAITTVSWLTITFLTKPTDSQKLIQFYRLVRPGGPGWKTVVCAAAERGEPVEASDAAWEVPTGILCTLLGSVLVWSAVLGVGYWIYREVALALAMTAVVVVCAIVLLRLWRGLGIAEETKT